VQCRLVLLTTQTFWSGLNGSSARIRMLADALSRRVALSVLVPQALPDEELLALRRCLPQARCASLGLPQSGRRSEALRVLAAWLASQPQDACLFEFLDTDWLRAAVPQGVLTLIDTHNVSSDLPTSAAATAISVDEERRRLAAFDRVIAIAEPDRQRFAGWLGAQRVLLVPHAVQTTALPLPQRDAARRVLFVGSQWAPNVVALRAFIDECWPALAPTGLRLSVAGGAGLAARVADMPGVDVLGRLPDLRPAYADADIVINPVVLGSGLKIKSLEALAHGRPLVASPHALGGLPEPDLHRACAVAVTAADFVRAITTLAADPARRQAMAEAALQLVGDHFSAVRCHASLWQALGLPSEERAGK